MRVFFDTGLVGRGSHLFSIDISKHPCLRLGFSYKTQISIQITFRSRSFGMFIAYGKRSLPKDVEIFSVGTKVVCKDVANYCTLKKNRKYTISEVVISPNRFDDGAMMVGYKLEECGPFSLPYDYYRFKRVIDKVRK